jgi:hypothetical protein
MSALTTAEQRARALIVLRSAADLYREKRGLLFDCIKLAAASFVDAEYARRVLRGVLWTQDLPEWETHPMRRRADVWRALNLAIRWCSRRAGGWRVNGVERPARATVPCSRQWLEWLPSTAR